MKVTPQIVADFEEYPELRILADTALRRVVELMEIHDIAAVRRLRKTGVFDHPYAKDIVTPMGVASVPSTVAAARYPVGKALLDYLETIGISGVSLEVSAEEVKAVATLWLPGERREKPADELEPKPVSEPNGQEKTPEPDEKKSPVTTETTKEENNDGQTND